MRPYLWMFAALPTAFLYGCTTEYEVNHTNGGDAGGLPAVGSDLPGDPPGGGHPSGGSGGGGGGNAGGGPWGSLNPGALPDVYFAVAIGTPGSWWDCYATDGLWCGCCDYDDCDGDGLCDWAEVPYSNSGGFYGGDVSYVVIDLRGHVISEFTPPDSHFTPGNVQHLDLRPAGPGQFMAVTWLPGLDGNATDGEVPSYDEDSDGLAGGFSSPDAQNRWLAWSGDAVTHQTTRLVKGDTGSWYSGDAHVVGTGEPLPLRGDWQPQVHLAVPADQPGELLAWSGWALRMPRPASIMWWFRCSSLK